MRAFPYIAGFLIGSGVTFLVVHKNIEETFHVKQQTINELNAYNRTLETELASRQKIIIETFGDGKIIKRQIKTIDVAEKKSPPKPKPSKNRPWLKKVFPQKKPSPVEPQATYISYMSQTPKGLDTCIPLGSLTLGFNYKERAMNGTF